MDCKEAKRAIPLFFADELEGKRLREFVKHVQGCPECMEEASIQYLATEGVARLEEGTTFDLDRELQEKLNLAIQRQKIHRDFKYLLVLIEIIAVLIILFVLFYAFI